MIERRSSNIQTLIIIIIILFLLVLFVNKIGNLIYVLESDQIKIQNSLSNEIDDIKNLMNKYQQQGRQPIKENTDYRIKISSTIPTYKLYLHGKGDMISDRVFQTGVWDDCMNILNIVTNKFGNLKKLSIVEIGTNIGACAIPYISKGHKVYGFEPFPPSIELVRKSIKENPYLTGELILIEAAASNRKGEANIFFEHGNFGNSRVGNNTKNYSIKGFNYEKYEKIRLTTIDSVVHEHINLLKMDCQGFEYTASLGAINLIKKYGIDIVIFELTPIFIEANNQNPVDILLFFSDNNFNIYHNDKILEISQFKSFVNDLKNTRLDTTIVCYNKDTKF